MLRLYFTRISMAVQIRGRKLMHMNQRHFPCSRPGKTSQSSAATSDAGAHMLAHAHTHTHTVEQLVTLKSWVAVTASVRLTDDVLGRWHHWDEEPESSAMSKGRQRNSAGTDLLLKCCCTEFRKLLYIQKTGGIVTRPVHT
jgi:hypothetical protein